MTIEQIAKVIYELAVKPFGKKAVLAYDVNEMAAMVHRLAGQYHVDPRLALAQGILECHFGANPAASRSRKTKNIFNVGNVDDGRNRFFASWEDGMRAYFHLMAREYCYRNEGQTVTAEMMIAHDFVRPRGGRYATAPSYTKDVAALVKKIDAMSEQRTVNSEQSLTTEGTEKSREKQRGFTEAGSESCDTKKTKEK